MRPTLPHLLGSRLPIRRGFCLWLVMVAGAFLPGAARAAGTTEVSYYRDIVPLFKRSCTGCHNPSKMKGKLDLTTYPAFSAGGKEGPGFKIGDPENSHVMSEIKGPEPSMPKEGDPLSNAEVELIARWIREGAWDDSPDPSTLPKETAPALYDQPPLISALAYSPDGNMLAVSGYHEVLLHKADGSALLARLGGESPRIESLAFSADGKLLAVSGGMPSENGEIQIWEVASNRLVKSFKISNDTLFGVSFSPDAQRVAFGCADKTARVISASDGKELVKFDNHSDWVFGTLFTVDGQRFLTGSRDRAMKLVDARSGQFIDDINKLLEGILCIARNPKIDQVAYGGDLGTPRIYKIAENQGRTAANNDVNLVKELERQPGAIHAVAFSPDGNNLAVGGVGGEVRLYKISDGTRLATFKTGAGAVFSVAFNPKKTELAFGGFEGKVRIFNTASTNLITAFVPVPLKAPAQVASVPK